MGLTFVETKGSLKRFRRTSWRFQQTFHIPHKELQPFVAGIIACLQPIQAGCVTIEQVVFEPRNLNALFARHSIATIGRGDTRHFQDWSISCNGQEDVEELLRVVFSEAIDFVFVPTPKRFTIYADHDEYATFFSITKGHLSRVVHGLTEQGFQPVPDYERQI